MVLFEFGDSNHSDEVIVLLVPGKCPQLFHERLVQEYIAETRKLRMTSSRLLASGILEALGVKLPKGQGANSIGQACSQPLHGPYYPR